MVKSGRTQWPCQICMDRDDYCCCQP